MQLLCFKFLLSEKKNYSTFCFLKMAIKWNNFQDISLPVAGDFQHHTEESIFINSFTSMLDCLYCCPVTNELLLKSITNLYRYKCTAFFHRQQ